MTEPKRPPIDASPDPEGRPPPFDEVDYRHLVLYDGVCGLCNITVRWILARDRDRRFAFAALESEVGRAELERVGLDADEKPTMHIILEHRTENERHLDRGRGALAILRELGGVWRAVALLRFLPRFLLDAGYRFVAARRYRLFGKFESRPLPEDEVRGRFVDLDEAESTGDSE